MPQPAKLYSDNIFKLCLTAELYAIKIGDKYDFLESETYYLLLLRWLKDEIATFYQLCHDSSGIGNFRDSPNSKENYELTGERQFGGLYGFVGNTVKIVKKSSTFYAVGEDAFGRGSAFPICSKHKKHHLNARFPAELGLMELIR